MLGKILGGRYEILEEIGKGGMAYVYKAKCILLNRIVAVKVLRDDLDGGEEFLERFNTEAQAAASLSHSNIVSIFDVGIDHGKHYIVMEYVDGITLKEYITQNGKLSYKESLDIAYQICDAMQAAHEKNIVHRDIKPHNILITGEKNIKVTDFGIARSGATTRTLSGENDILGSVHYISPEQAKGEIVDTRSDLYSLGIVVYEMLTGRVPFDADTPVAVAMMQIENDPPMEFDPSLPKGLLQIVCKAMCKEKVRRYQNAEEIKNDILSIIEDGKFVLSDGDVYYIEPESDNFSSEPKKLKYPLRIFIVLLSVITSIVIVASAIVVYNIITDSDGSAIELSVQDKIPSFIGLTLDDAQKLAAEKGYKVIVSDEVEDSNSKPGTIVSQTPRENSDAGQEFTIKVIINKKSASELKNYTGKSYKSAEEELEELGCKVNLIFEESKKDEDLIIRQSPESGTKITKDMTVTLYVSSGIDEDNSYKTVPTLTGKTYAKCAELLESAELSVGSISGVNAPSSDDIVVYQAIPAGSMVKPGSAVGITLKSKKTNNDTQSDESNKPSESYAEEDDKTAADSNDKTHTNDVADSSENTLSNNKESAENPNLESGEILNNGN